MRSFDNAIGSIGCLIALGVFAPTASAQYLLPGTGTTQATSGVTVFKPLNTSAANSTRTGASASAFVDDVFLTSMTFGSQTFTSNVGQFRPVGNVNIVSGATNVNAEYGDSDTNSDGSPNPFLAAGVSDVNRETTDPAIQRPAIRAAFNTFSLNEGIDGEGTPFTLDLIFQNGINDNNSASDSVPELIFFERGANSTYSLQAIIGGTFAAPLLAPNTITINSSSATQARLTGYFIDTIEIASGQQLAATGLDLNPFFTGTPSTVYGVRIVDVNGADLYGNFISAASANQFVPVPAGLQGDGFISSNNVPEPTTLALLLPLAGTLLLRRKK